MWFPVFSFMQRSQWVVHWIKVSRQRSRERLQYLQVPYSCFQDLCLDTGLCKVSWAQKLPEAVWRTWQPWGLRTLHWCYQDTDLLFHERVWEASRCGAQVYPLQNEYPGFPEGSTCILSRSVVLNDWSSWRWRSWLFNRLLWCQSTGIYDLVCCMYLKSQASVTLGPWVLGLVRFKLTRLPRRNKRKSSVSLSAASLSHLYSRISIPGTDVVLFVLLLWCSNYRCALSPVTDVAPQTYWVYGQGHGIFWDLWLDLFTLLMWCQRISRVCFGSCGHHSCYC